MAAASGAWRRVAIPTEGRPPNSGVTPRRRGNGCGHARRARSRRPAPGRSPGRCRIATDGGQHVGRPANPSPRGQRNARLPPQRRHRSASSGDLERIEKELQPRGIPGRHQSRGPFPCRNGPGRRSRSSTRSPTISRMDESVLRSSSGRPLPAIVCVWKPCSASSRETWAAAGAASVQPDRNGHPPPIVSAQQVAQRLPQHAAQQVPHGHLDGRSQRRGARELRGCAIPRCRRCFGPPTRPAGPRVARPARPPASASPDSPQPSTPDAVVTAPAANATGRPTRSALTAT